MLNFQKHHSDAYSDLSNYTEELKLLAIEAKTIRKFRFRQYAKAHGLKCRRRKDGLFDLWKGEKPEDGWQCIVYPSALNSKIWYVDNFIYCCEMQR